MTELSLPGRQVASASYYTDKLGSLRELFGTERISVEPDRVRVGESTYPIVDDVIVLLEPEHYPPGLRRRLAVGGTRSPKEPDFAEDIQSTFGAEWREFPELMPEYADEFRHYFDLVDVANLETARVCDLGCGGGRWSYQLRDRCRQLVLVDFSDAIFVARRNLRDSGSTIFLLGDLSRLPLAADSCDLMICLGVLHHLPVNALDALRRLAGLAPRHLVYLYYALDNRPAHFRVLLRMATAIRILATRIRGRRARAAIVWLGAVGLYLPLVGLGTLLRPFRLERLVPLYDSYGGKSLRRIRQDVYDRLFTRIEQRFTKAEIETLRDTFERVTVSGSWPYWHFLCER